MIALSRVSSVEKELKRRQSSVSTRVYDVSQISTQTNVVDGGNTFLAPAVSVPMPPTPTKPSLVEQAWQWFLQDWLVKLGAVLIFLAFGWIIPFLVWDIIGPFGRVIFGILCGILLLIFGTMRIRNFRNQGSIFLSLGAGIVYLSIAAGQFVYDMFPSVMALTFLFLTTVFLAYVSIAERTRALAFLALILGSLAPMLIHSSSHDFIGLFLYLFILTLGVLWVTRITSWRELTTTALVIYIFYSLPYIFNLGVHTDFSHVLSAAVFALLFFIFNIASIVHDREAQSADLVAAALNTLILIGWIDSAIVPEAKSFAAVLAAIAASFGAYAVYVTTRISAPVIVHSASAMLLLVAATAYELDGSIFTIALTFEITLLIIGLIALLGRIALAKQTSFLLVVPLVMVFSAINRYSYSREVFTTDFFAILAVLLSIVAVGYIFVQSDQIQEHESEDVSVGVAWSVIGALLAMLLLWLVTHIAIVSVSIATAICLTVYTLIGLYGYITGQMYQRKNRKLAGTALLIFVVCHLIFVEIGSLDTGGRILVFMIVGILLMSTAFLGRRKGISTE